MSKQRRLHPLQIFPYIGKYLFFLLIPLMRSFFMVRTPAALYHWLRGAWLDILTLLLIVLFAYFRWRYSTLRITKQVLVIQNGLFIRREIVIPFTAISALSVETPFYLLPFRAKRVYVDTPGGHSKKTDLHLLLSDRDAEDLLRYRVSDAPIVIYRPRRYALLLLALFISGATTGTLFFATLLRQVGKVLGRDFRELLLSELGGVVDFLRFLPRAAAWLAVLLTIGFTVSVFRSLLYFGGFSVRRHQHLLCIETGWIIKRYFTCHIEYIYYLDFCQTVLSYFGHIYLTFIYCIGYGKRKNEHAVILPALPHRRVSATIQQFLPSWSYPALHIRPVKHAIWRYTRWPRIALLLLFSIELALQIFFPFLRHILFWGGIICIVPLLWRFIAVCIERRRAGIGYQNGYYTVCYARGFRLHTCILPCTHVGYIRVRQSLFQKISNTCDLYVYSHSDRKTMHRIRQLSKDEVQIFLTGIEVSPFC